MTRAALVSVAALFILGHAGHVARQPDSIDATNFVLGVRDFDVARHQPHPPGYPVYIALGHAALAFVPVSTEPDAGSSREALALSALGIVLGGLAVVPLALFFRALDRPLASPLLAVAAAALVLACPLYWFSSVRPMSDVAGMTIAVLTQALVVSAIARLAPLDSASIVRPGDMAAARRLVLAATALAGFAIGVRSQTVWLTAPLIGVALWLLAPAASRFARATAVAGAVFTLGVLAWLVPLAVFPGALDGYLDALGGQAADDFAGGYMLAMAMSPRQVAGALYDTLILPWASPDLGVIVIALALIGAIRLWHTGPRRLALLAAATAPYGAFHLLFQDTSYARYALPLVPATVWLAANGLTLLTGRAAAWILVAVGVGGITLSATAVGEHLRMGTPANRALDDVRGLAAGDKRPRMMAMHRGVWQALRHETLPFPILESVQGYEWRELARYWIEGNGDPVWFLAIRRRTDLAFMDTEARRLVRSYPWTFDRRPYLGAARPGGVDWFELRPPGWFVTEGWSLTPEMAGLSAVERAAGVKPLVAYVRRRDAEATMVIGGRLLDGAGPDVRIRVSLDANELESFAVAPGEPFLQFVRLPAGALSGPGSYATVSVHAAADGTPASLLPLVVEQFDVELRDGQILAFGAGWHSAEYDFERGEMWRWTARRAALHLDGVGERAVLRLRGAVPDAHPDGLRVEIRMGAALLGRFHLAGEFDIDVPIEGRALSAAGGVVWLEADRGWVPASTGESADSRELALRVIDVELQGSGALGLHAWQASRERHRYP